MTALGPVISARPHKSVVVGHAPRAALIHAAHTPHIVRAHQRVALIQSTRQQCTVMAATPVIATSEQIASQVPVYIGPTAGAPQNVTRPYLLVLREAGAPASQTSIVIREPGNA